MTFTRRPEADLPRVLHSMPGRCRPGGGQYLPGLPWSPDSHCPVLLLVLRSSRVHLRVNLRVNFRVNLMENLIEP